jgi:probable HAF family extracellular repeat protein
MREDRFVYEGVCAMLVVLVSVSSAGAQAQSAPPHGHHHYKVIDVGTFGGPGGGTEGPASPSMNNRGMTVGVADTSLPDPFAPSFCFLDCNVDLGFWQHDGFVTTLPPPPSGVGLSSFGYAINHSGWIVGQAENGYVDASTGWPIVHPVLWKNGIPHDLGALGGTQGIANAINDRGQIVGASLTGTPDPFSNAPIGSGCASPNAYGLSPATFAVCTLFYPASTETHAFVWKDGVMRDLGTLGGPDSNAFINNAHGEVAGWSYTSFVANASTGVPTIDPFYWNPEDGTMTDLGGLGGTLGTAVWINNRGQIAGVSNIDGDITAHPFLWSKEEGMLDLFAHGGLGGTFGHPDWMNDKGEVVGFARTAGDLVGHAFLWRDGKMIDLGTLGTDAFSEAASINSHGQVVGGTFTQPGGTDLRGFLWEKGGPMVDLNTLLVDGSSTYIVSGGIINDRGEIDCTGSDDGGATHHACVLIPCDDDHSGVEGCDYSLVEEATVAQTPSAPAIQSEPVTKESLRTMRRGGILKGRPQK